MSLLTAAAYRKWAKEKERKKKYFSSEKFVTSTKTTICCTLETEYIVQN